MDFEAGKDMSPELTEFITSRLIGHIMESDKQFGAYLKGRATM